MKSLLLRRKHRWTAEVTRKQCAQRCNAGMMWGRKELWVQPDSRRNAGIRKSAGKIKALNIDVLILKTFIKLRFKLHRSRTLLEKKLMFEAIKHDLAELFNKSTLCETWNSWNIINTLPLKLGFYDFSVRTVKREGKITILFQLILTWIA